MSDWEQVLQREAAAHVLAGGRVCPLYRLPAWVCSTLHLLTGVCRTVTTGAFGRFTSPWPEDSADDGGTYRPWIAHHYCCPHDPDSAGATYWSTVAASTLDPKQLSIQGGP